jgi:Tol biopolymer transport system component
MTRSDRSRGRQAAPPRGSRDPYGLLPKGTPFAAILAIVGLLAIAFATLSVGSGDLPFVTGGGGGNGGPGASGAPGNGGVTRTPTPSNVVIIPEDPLADVPGSIVYVKAGNVWLQSGRTARQLTSSGRDSMATFAPDGQSVFFVRTREADGYWFVDGVGKEYRLEIPSIMRIPIEGGDATRVLDGIVDPPGRRKWQGWIQGPVVSPDGRTIAMATDLPDPTTSDVVLKLLTLKSGKITDPKLSQRMPLGHQDPAWRPDGKRLLYVRNDRDGAKGAPRIYSYNPASKKAAAVTGPGYLHPTWSPDGRFIAATRTSAIGTDVVILDGASGAELLRLTDDGDSWGPAWSPRGDQIAWLHVDGQVVDLRMAQLDGAAPAWTVTDVLDLTSSAGLDSVSRPDWFIPADELPAPSVPAASPVASQPVP